MHSLKSTPEKRNPIAPQEMSHDAPPTNNNNEAFPWHLGIFDAHCHPTDTMSSITEILQMKARTLTVMSTRGEDQDLVYEAAAAMDYGCDDSQDDKQIRILPCFGWHPWFSYQILLDHNGTPGGSSSTDAETKKAHYEKVLAPPPRDKPDGQQFITALPPPKPLSTLISETRTRLLSHPSALVGEIGLDRAFRLPNPWTQEEIAARDSTVTPGSREGRTLSPYRVHLEHQKSVLRAQLQLAGELQRPVSLHSVQAHGAVFDVLKELWTGCERRVPTRRERRRRYSAAGAHEESDAEENIQHNPNTKTSTKKEENAPSPFPPRICMHSYSGPVDPVKQFLHPSNPSDVYFSFSNVINFRGPSAQKVIEVVKVLPDERVLVESDLHTAGPVMDELLEDVVRQICEIRGWGLVDGVQRLGDNWIRFVYG